MYYLERRKHSWGDYAYIYHTSTQTNALTISALYYIRITIITLVAVLCKPPPSAMVEQSVPLVPTHFMTATFLYIRGGLPAFVIYRRYS